MEVYCSSSSSSSSSSTTWTNICRFYNGQKKKEDWRTMGVLKKALWDDNKKQRNEKVFVSSDEDKVEEETNEPKAEEKRGLDKNDTLCKKGEMCFFASFAQ